MKPDPDCEPAADATRRGDPQIGDGTVTLQSIRNRLRHAAQVDRIVSENPERAIEIGRKAAANDDSSHRGPNEHERRKARTAEG